jgi:mannose-1-phosphate guanylyltransferase
MTWTIVLAGGAGSRLAEESRRRYGYNRPKQYCDFDGTGTLLEKTLARGRRFADARHTLVVTTRAHRAEAQEILRFYPGIRTIEQPCGRETTPGIALPILHVYGRDPDDLAVLLPSDHHVADEAVFAAAVQRALEAVARHPDRIGVIGAEPGELCEGYGWIVPKPGLEHHVARFAEKPPSVELAGLRAAGALVNTFVLVGRVRTLAVLIGRHAPGWWRALMTSYPDPAKLDAAFEVLPPSNFSTDVLERIPDRLELIRLDARAGWSDVGTPDRLAHALTPSGAPVSVGRRPRQHPDADRLALAH